jgi:hypothetical protein
MPVVAEFLQPIGEDQPRGVIEGRFEDGAEESVLVSHRRTFLGRPLPGRLS